MKSGIIQWWNTLCYKNNRRRLTKANVDSSFKNSCPKSCLDHWNWIFKPLKLQERARTHILYQKGTILTKTRGWLCGTGTEVTVFTLLQQISSWTKEWQRHWSMWHSPSGSEPGQTSDLQQAIKDHFQTQVGFCGILNKRSSPSVIYPFLSAAAQTKSVSIQGYKWQRDLRISTEGGQAVSIVGLNCWWAKNNLLLWERWLSGSVPLREGPRPHSQGTSNY